MANSLVCYESLPPLPGVLVDEDGRVTEYTFCCGSTPGSLHHLIASLIRCGKFMTVSYFEKELPSAAQRLPQDTFKCDIYYSTEKEHRINLWVSALLNRVVHGQVFFHNQCTGVFAFNIRDLFSRLAPGNPWSKCPSVSICKHGAQRHCDAESTAISDLLYMSSVSSGGRSSLTDDVVHVVERPDVSDLLDDILDPYNPASIHHQPSPPLPADATTTATVPPSPPLYTAPPTLVGDSPSAARSPNGAADESNEMYDPFAVDLAAL